MFRSLFFPAQPRSFPLRREVKIALRAAHVLCAGVVTGAFLFDVGGRPCNAWLVATVVTGLSILLLDLHESGAFLLQVRGVVLLIKVALLAAVPMAGGRAGWLLAAIVIVSVVSSHAPSRLRYHMVFGGTRIRGAETRG